MFRSTPGNRVRNGSHDRDASNGALDRCTASDIRHHMAKIMTQLLPASLSHRFTANSTLSCLYSDVLFSISWAMFLASLFLAGGMCADASTAVAADRHG